MKSVQFTMPAAALSAIVTLITLAAVPASAAPASEQATAPHRGAVAVKDLPAVSSMDPSRSGVHSGSQIQEVYGPYFIVNGYSGKCANVEGGSTANGVPLIQYTCGSSLPNDRWYFSHLGGGYYYLVNVHSTKCANVEGASTTSGARVIQFTCGSSLPNDIWGLYYLPNGRHYWFNLYSGMCMRVAGFTTADFAAVVQTPCGSLVPNDEWLYVA